MARGQRDPDRERMWRERVLAWGASGLSIRAYCDQHQLTETTFQYWRRELREREVASSVRPSVSPSSRPLFVPVTVAPSVEQATKVGPVEVRCPSGHVVILPSCDSSSFANLFAALASPIPEGRPC